jgi:hypothetical protein
VQIGELWCHLVIVRASTWRREGPTALIHRFQSTQTVAPFSVAFAGTIPVLCRATSLTGMSRDIADS